MKETYFNEDGQPLDPRFNLGRRTARNYDELIGMIRGIVADGQVHRAEADLLARWCLQYGFEAREWPIGVIVKRLNRIYEDGIVTPDELDDLGVLLQNIVGGLPGEVESASTLPLTRPVPEVVFQGNVFAFTGRFACGTRHHCFTETAIRGGVCEDTINLRVDYLVIGSLNSRDWAHSAWGRKIERAMHLQRSKPIAIIHEETWSKVLL